MFIVRPQYFVTLYASMTLCFPAMAQGTKPKSKLYEFGKPTQQVTPRYVKETTRPDGSKSIVFGNKKSGTDKIGDPHGHTVKNPDGTLGYSRTIGGKVIYDDKAKKK